MLSVLVIDDHKDLLELLRVFLERFGEMRADTAASSKEALARMNERSYDALVVDFDLPDISGIEFLKIIRARGDTTPVIIFTGVGREFAAIEALNHGADFFLKKGDDPQEQFRTLIHMIMQARERRTLGRGIGTSARLLEEAIAFFSDPAYAVDREGNVIAWNQAMTEFTGIEAERILGKGNAQYSLPFFGRPAPMLTDLVQENDHTLIKSGYTIIRRDEETIYAWVKAPGNAGEPRVLWMKASPLRDGRGHFVGTLGAVRDITDELGEELLHPPVAAAAPEGSAGGLENVLQKIPFNRFFGKAKSHYKQGLHCANQEKNYREAIRHFEKSLEIDPGFAPAWYECGMALQKLAREEEAVLCIDRAIEIDSRNEEFLFTRADLLKRKGILTGREEVLNAAAQAYKELLEMNPDHADAWNSLSSCMKAMGDDEMARQCYCKGQELIRSGKSTGRIRSLDTLI